MRLEFEPNASVVPFVEKDVVSRDVSSDSERMLREGIKAAQEGNRAQARNLLIRVTETNADNENAWLWLASISEYPEELLVFLNNVLRINAHNERALEWHKATKSLLAKTLVQRGIDAVRDERQDFARQCFEQALEHEAENEMAWLWMASVAGSEEEKTACLEKVLSVNPDNEAARESLKSIQSQKMQKMFQDALSAAFDGRHMDAKEMLGAVLSQNPEMEDAWVLKSHIADSFEERAECFLKLSALNPENEMAKANLASWRMLADLRAAQPKAEEEAAEFAVQEHEEGEEFSNDEAVAEFSDYSSNGFSAQTEPEQAAAAVADFSAGSEAETAVLDFSQPREAARFDEAESAGQEAFAAEFSPVEEYAEPDSPTEDLSFNSYFEPQKTEQNQFVEKQAEEENFDEEFEDDEILFESNEPTQQPAQEEKEEEYSEPASDLAAQLEAEEEEMNWAFANSQEATKEAEDYFRTLDESDEDIHKTQQANYDAEDFAQEEEAAEDSVSELQAETAGNFTETTNETADEPQNDEWKNTSPSMFVNYSPAMPENYFEAQTVEFVAPETVVAALEENPTEFAAVIEEEPASVPQWSAENNYSYQFAPKTEEFVETREAQMSEQFPSQEVEESVIEQFAAQEELVEESFESQPEEKYPLPKAETVLCPFCNTANDKQAFSCNSCQTVLTLSDLEMLLGQQTANEDKLRQAVESLERENESYGLNAEQLTNLGVGQINLKNYRQGFLYLQESVRMNPSNVLLDAQVNALAIRLSEMEEQQSVHDSMPKNRKILVVDDSPTVRKLISGKLEKCGHEVICAIDGVDALEKINELKPDLVLLDITMPRMDGYQVCKLIRNNETTKDVPVVMISGKDGFFDKVRGRMAGTTGYITKPFGPETLMKTVETYLN
jgi:CheY-like chemotaxis protein